MRRSSSVPIYESIEPREWIFVKDCGFLSFAKYVAKNIGKNICNKYI